MSLISYNGIKEDKYTRTTTGMDWENVAAYVYDETNRMVEGKNEQGEYSLYTYNGLGVRVARELIMQDNTHGYTDFHSETPSVETGLTRPEVVKESYVIDYTSATFNALTMDEAGGFNYRYVYGLDRLSVKITGEGTNWWGQNTTTNILKDYYHQDRLGSTTNLTDIYGRVVGRADYNEWGQITYRDALNITSSYRRIYPQLNYTGYDWDDVLGMYYAKARFYSADDKRFVAMDPVKGQITDPLSLVSYLYCVDNPLRWVDPLGLVAVNTGLNQVAFDGNGGGNIPVTSSKFGAVVLQINSKYIEGEIFYGDIFVPISTLIDAYGITVANKSWSKWNEEESTWDLIYSDDSATADIIYNRNMSSLKLELINSNTNMTKTIYADVIGEGIPIEEHYIRLDVFRKVMCELGYSQSVVEYYSDDAKMLKAGKMTNDDLTFATTNPTVWAALQELNNSWVEIKKRAGDGYDIGNMEYEVLELMDVMREIGNKKKIPKFGFDVPILEKANASATERVLYRKNVEAARDILLFGAYARMKTEKLYGNGYPVGNNADAYRHTLWSFMSASADVEMATLFTNAHEYMEWTNFLVSGTPNQLPLTQTQMDLYNNHMGIEGWVLGVRNLNLPELLIEEGMLLRIDEKTGKLIPTDKSGKAENYPK